MKKLRNVLFILLSSILLFSCEYDDADLWSEIDHIKTELTQINKQVASVESLVEALNKGKIITQVDQLAEGNGYVITFNDGSKIEVVNGENAPVIGIKNVDGVYYWTIETNGIVEFLLDSDNNKLRVSGEDGNTPALAVDDQGYWTLNGERIIDANGQPIKAVGNDGDSFFTKITETEESVIFELVDGTTIEIPKQLETSLVFEAPEDDSSYFFFNFDEEKELKLKTANIVSAEIVEQPKGWSIKLNLSKKSVTVKSPKQNNQSYSGGFLKIQGVDKNGLVFLAQADLRASIDFTDPDGTFVVCEGNMTTVNGMLVYYDKAKKEYQNVFKNANNGLEIGNVVQDIYIANNKIYLLTQNGSRMGGAGRFVVCDARTLKMEYADPLNIQTPEGKGTWPQHLVVTSENRAYVQYSDNEMETTSGICELELGDQSITVKNTIEGTFGAFTSEGATKTRMIFSKGKLFAGVGHSLIIINPTSSSVEKKIPFEGRQVKGVVKGADGNIYIALASPFEGSQNFGTVFTSNSKIVSINHAGEILSEQDLPEDVQFPVSTWSPAIGLCASFTNSHLYFIDSADFNATSATRYNYITKEVDVNYLKSTETIYGVMGIHPTSKEWWVATSSYVDSQVFVYDVSGDMPHQKSSFRYKTQMGASPAAIDFTYRFSTEWVNR